MLGISLTHKISEFLSLVLCAVVGVGFIVLAYSLALPKV